MSPRANWEEAQRDIVLCSMLRVFFINVLVVGVNLASFGSWRLYINIQIPMELKIPGSVKIHAATEH